MPDAASPAAARCLVSNTSPLLALTAATGGLDVLRHLYPRVVVPLEVADEVRVGGHKAFGVDVFNAAADWLEIQPAPVALQPFLHNSLDKGEAAVIQTALNLRLPLVCIGEAVGRRVARLCNLQLTGSVGVLIKARKTGFALDMAQALDRMRQHGIWLSDRVVQFALSH
jgi:predicted nucleic acid-binding protein